jgi:predicted nucleotidyltransferase
MSHDAETTGLEHAFTDVVESFYLETQEGMFFAVKGLEHPPGRLIAVLRYAPDPEKGNRRKRGLLYRRFYHFAEQEQFIKTACPHYMAYDPVFQTTLQSVPKSRVLRAYDPRLRMHELALASVRKEIEEDAVAFVRLLQKEAEVPLSAFGITGSLLIGLNTELSDLDVAVFGMQNCNKVYRILQNLLDADSCSELRRLDMRGFEALYAQRVVDTRMAFDEFVSLETRKVNQGSFRRRPYFVRFIKEAHESGQSYGHCRYTPLGRARITASITDDQGAIFTPCSYGLSGVRSFNGLQYPDLNEIVSFRGRFCEQARTGESMIAEGTLERVRSNRGDVRHRLLLGYSPEDTMVARK